MITVYSKKNCPECERMFAVLDGGDIKYEVVKVDENPDARTFLVGAGHRSVPQVYLEGKPLGASGILIMLGAEGIKNLILAHQDTK